MCVLAAWLCHPFMLSGQGRLTGKALKGPADSKMLPSRALQKKSTDLWVSMNFSAAEKGSCILSSLGDYLGQVPMATP